MPDNLVSLDIDAPTGLATLTIQNPPVNALPPDVWDAAFPLLRKAHANPEVKAIIITGANGKFSAGFDFRIFGTPAMPAVLERRSEVPANLAALLESGAKPTVAAIEGLALGAQLGLPEVRLGLLPGMGGTQRLPRLVGVPQALNLLLSGQPIPAEDALAIGLADQVVPADQLLTTARAAALDLASGKAPRRRALQLTQHMQGSGEVFVEAVTAVAEARARVQRSLAGQQHYVWILEAVAAGLAQGAATGLQKEGEGFRALCKSRLHRMLLAMFKLHRRLKKARGPAWALLQVQLFLGLVWVWLYVHVIYVWTSFKFGYDKARKKKQAGGDAAAGAAAGAGATGRPSTTRKKTR